MTSIEKQKKYLNIIYPIVLFALTVLSVFSYGIPIFVMPVPIAFFVYALIIENKGKTSELKTRIKNIYLSAKWLIISLFVYILIDVATYFYSINLLSGLRKTRLFVQFGLLLLMGVYYIVSELKFKFFLLTVAFSGTAVSVWAYLCYFIQEKPTYFYRISTASDYNYFTTIIVTGLVFGLIYFMNFSKLSYGKRCLCSLGLLIVNIPVIYLSGSRRMMIMTPLFCLFTFLYEGIRLLVKKDKKRLLQMIGILGMAVVVYFGAMAVSVPFTKYAATREKNYKEMLAQTGTTDSTLIVEPSISQIIGTINDGSMSNRRSIIYGEAIDNIKKFSVPELIFGKGAAYDLYMFDNTTNETLLKEYSYNLTDKRPPKNWMSSHCFVISDMLNGGLVKTLAGLWFTVMMIAYAVIAMRRKKRVGAILTVGLTLIIVNNSISGEFGYFNDVFFAVIMIVLISVLTLYNKKISKSEITENDK